MTTSTKRPPYPFKRLFKDGIYAFLLNVVIALLITLVNGGAHFIENIVVSMCIGTVAFFLVDGARLGIWGPGVAVTWKPFIAIVLAAVPIAQIGGSYLAEVILQNKMPDLNAFSTTRGISWMLFTLVAVGCAALIFWILERVARAEASAATERARAESIERQALQAQLQLLQAQIEPHMLFNTLANLQGMIAIDPARAQAMLDQLIVYLRATLSSSRAQATTLAQEFALMEAYLGLMSVRMGPRLAFTLTLPEALRAASMPPMLLQPLVENAIMHGLEPKIGGGHITVSAALDADTLVVCVTDTGLGLDSGLTKPGTHLGVANTRERLHALFGARACLTLEPNQPFGALARITLPIALP